MIIDDLKNGFITKEQAVNEYSISINEVEEIIEKYWFHQ